MLKGTSRIWLLAASVALISSPTIGQSIPTNTYPVQTDGGAMMLKGRLTSQSILIPADQRKPSRRPIRALPGPGVRHNVPQDFPTIQSAIDASVDGDTVLISDAIYYENIRFKGKGIVVGSTFLIDADTGHIANTIIDGSHATHPDSSSVVYFIDGEDTTSVLCGLTIQGGRGTAYYLDLVIPAWIRVGGGVMCEAAGARISRNYITHNRIIAKCALGGGLSALGTESFVPFIILEHNRITENFVQNDTVSDISGCSGGADIGGASARVVGNVFERDTVTSKSGAVGGGMTFWPWSNTSPRPRGYIADNIFRDNKLFARNSGAVGGGMLVVLTDDVVIIQNVFEGNVAASIYGWAQGGGLCIDDQFTSSSGRKTVIRNEFLNNRVQSQYGSGGGGGVALLKTLATLSGNYFAHNVATGPQDFNGGAFQSGYSSFRLEGNIITGNSATNAGGGLDIGSPPQQGTEQIVVNNIISGNSANLGGALEMWGSGSLSAVNNTIVGNSANIAGGGAVFSGNVEVLLMNNIVWDNWVGSVRNQISHQSIPGQYYNNDIQGGWSGGIDNISADPRFADSTYRLSDSSLCIGGGIDSAQISGRWYRPPASDIYGSLRPDPPGSYPDIGACENPFATAVGILPLTIVPLLYDYENVRPGSVSDTLNIVFRNKGPLPLSISSLIHSTTEFRFCQTPTLPLTIPPYGPAQLRMTFNPTAPGLVVRDTLVIASSDSLLPKGTVFLRGRGSGPPCGAQGTSLYDVSESSGTLSLYEIDKSKADANLTAQFSPHPPTGLTAFSVRQADRMLYAAFSSGTATVIYRLSSSFGDLELSANIPVSGLSAMAFSSGDGLYLADTCGRLYMMQGFSGSVDTIGTMGIRLTGLAFSPATGELWGSAHDTVCTINTATGARTMIGHGYPGIGSSSIAFNSLGTLYGLFDNALVVIDRATGGVSNIGSTGLVGRQLIAMRSDPAAMNAAGNAELPRETKLEQNYPNPFNPTTIIRYSIPVETYYSTSLRVYDVLGREVAVLVNERREAGTHEVRFDGSGLASGVYLYRLTAGSFVQTRKLLLLK